MIAISTTPFNISMLRKKNVWYSVKDGNWSDPSVWQGNGQKHYSLPQPGDDVYVCHAVDYNNNLTSSYLFNNTINNLFVSGKLTAVNGGNQNVLFINGNLQCSGVIDFSTATVIKLCLLGVNNSIANFNCGTNSTIYYQSSNDADIMPLTYYTLNIGGTGLKTVIADLNATSLNIDSSSILELSSFNATVPNININGTLKKSSSTGTVNLTSANITGSINFTGNPTVNFYGNISGDFRNGVTFGSGTINVLANQSWNVSNGGNAPQSFCTNGTILIASGKTLTILGPSALLMNGTSTINGVDGTSILNINTGFAYGSTNTPMATGVFNYNNSGTSTIYVQSGITMTLPFTSFYNLTVTGTATLMGNTTVGNTLNVAGSLQIGGYNFTVSGNTNYQGSILNSGGGTVSFSVLNPQNSVGAITFTANPTVNLSGNINGDARAGLNFGTGTVNIIANMSITVVGGANVTIPISTNIVIASGKTLTNAGSGSTTGGLTITGTITGADATAILDNRSVFNYQNTTAPMATGKLYCNQAANTFIYGLAGNQDITVPSDATPGYQNLTLNNSGAKRLLGNVSVKGTYTLTSPATLNSNGFALTNP